MAWTIEQILHDRATRGEQLTAAEQVQLDHWYAELNRQESQAIFGQDEPPVSLATAQNRLIQLQDQVDESLAHLNLTMQRLQEVAAQNKQLRSENALLRIKVAEQGVWEVA